MSLITFDINNFERIVSGKYELGKEYAITFDPHKVLDVKHSRVGYRRAFALTNGKNRIMANDSQMFKNPIKTSEPVVCKFQSQRFLDTCAVVIFMFVPERMYMNDTYPNRLWENDINNPNTSILFGDFPSSGAPIAYGTSDKYIITDDSDELFMIELTNKESDAVLEDMTIEDLANMTFTAIDADGNQVELDTGLVKTLMSCKSIGIKDADGNYTSLFNNDVPEAERDKIADILSQVEAIKA